MVNGWFPKINSRGDIVSGNTEIWITYADGREVQVATDGGGAQWLTIDTLVYNLHNGGTVFWPARPPVMQGYSLITASETGLWAGAYAGEGGVDLYSYKTLIKSYPKACLPKFNGDLLGYLTPYQPESDNHRDLIINDKKILNDVIVDFTLGSPNIPVVSTGTYTRKFVNAIVVQSTEGAPVFSDGWIVSNAGNIDGLYVRPFDSYMGYFLSGEWYYHDFRKFGDSLLIVASTSGGRLKTIRLSINDARIDLRTIGSSNPIPNPPEPEPTPVPEQLQAPNKIETVRRMIRLHPEINAKDENQRGRIVDYFCNAENPPGSNKPWGRKARAKDGSNKNTDGVTFLRNDGISFEIYDVIAGDSGLATWDLGLPAEADKGKNARNDAGIWLPGENGYWAPAEPINGNTPVPKPENPMPTPSLTKEDVRDGSNAIIDFYTSQEGLQRTNAPIGVNDQAAWDWVSVYLLNLFNGMTKEQAIENVKSIIRTFPEWKQKHPNG